MPSCIGLQARPQAFCFSQCGGNIGRWDLPEAADVVGVVVPWDQVLDVLQESHRKGAGSAIVISAGFAERASTTAPYWVAPCR